MFQNTITIKLPLQISNTKNREYNYDTNMGQAQKCDGVILVNDIPPSSLDNYIQMYTNRYKIPAQIDFKSIKDPILQYKVNNLNKYSTKAVSECSYFDH